MFESEAPKMTKQDLRRWTVYPAIGGAVLGLVGYYTVGPGYAELTNGSKLPQNQHSVTFDMPNASPFDSISAN